MSEGYDFYDDFDADLHVKSLKETIVDAPCPCCGSEFVSQWDVETRHGVCADCFWDRCPNGEACRIDEFHPRHVF